MASPQSPVIIRQIQVQPWTNESSTHLLTIQNLFKIASERARTSKFLRVFLRLLVITGVSYCAYTMADEYVYQSFQNWVFDQGMVGRTDVTFFSYFKEDTSLGLLINGNQEHLTSDRTQRRVSTAPVPGVILGSLEIPRLSLTSLVHEGVDDQTLSQGVGHVPATSLAGQGGNFVMAAHRNTRFQALKNIGSGDLMIFQAADGNSYQYRVAATQIVKPSDVSMLRADGGGLITGGGSVQGMPKLLTVITCYPFSYTESAPKRFIVEARLVEDESAPKEALSENVSVEKLAEQATPAESVKLAHKTHAYGFLHRKAFRTRHILRRT